MTPIQSDYKPQDKEKLQREEERVMQRCRIARKILVLFFSLIFLPLLISAAQLARHEVTNAEYKKFVETTGHPPPEHWTNGEYPAGSGDEPVVLVNWHEAMAYCQWMGNQRLPTQEEWQEACQAPDFEKWGNVWEWTTTETKNPTGWKILCGPQGTCACSHRYNPKNKNFVKGFRCTRALPLALYHQ